MALNAQQAFARAERGKGRTVIGWKLDRAQRRELLRKFPPIFSEVIADHVTLVSRTRPGAQLPSEQNGEIVGRVHDGEGVEAMVVRIADTTDRPGGGSYHITWSLSPGRSAKESNDVIAKLGSTAINPPVPIKLQPAQF